MTFMMQLRKEKTMNRNDIKDANDFREAIIGITNYMAFFLEKE